MVMPRQETGEDNPFDPDGDTGGEGSWSQPFEFPPGSGRYVQNNSATGELRELETPGLSQDLAELGLEPLGGRREERKTGIPFVDKMMGVAEKVADPFGRSVNRGALMVDPETGLLYDRSGKLQPQWVHDSVYGDGGPGGSGDPYAGAKFSEQVRAQRIAEAQNAIDMQMQRVQAAQQARLEGAGFAVPPGTTHFPQAGPNDPAVRAGLISPVPITPVAFNPERITSPDVFTQAQSDLARIRGMAGVG